MKPGEYEREEGFAPSQMSIELASEVISAEAANKLTETRRVCKAILKDIDGLVRRRSTTPGEVHSLTLTVSRDYAVIVADALRIRGYGVCLSPIADVPGDLSISFTW